MTQPEFNFTNEIKNKVNNTTIKIAKKPFMKTAFLTVALGIAIGIGLSTFNYVIHIASEYSKESKIYNKQIFDLNIEKIKQISSENFQQFTYYLKENAKLYDELAFLAKESLVKAEVENYDLTTSANTYTKLINNKQTEFKIEIENVINTVSTVYSTIQKNSSLNIDNDNLQTFLKYYHNYQSKIYTRDSKLEKEINDAIYDVKQYNKKFNEQNGIFEKAKQLTLKMDNIKEINTSKIKP